MLIRIDFDDFTSPVIPIEKTYNNNNNNKNFIKPNVIVSGWPTPQISNTRVSNSRDIVDSVSLIGYPNTSNFVKTTPLRVAFSTLFSVFGYTDETLPLVFDISHHRDLSVVPFRFKSSYTFLVISSCISC